MTNSIGLKRNDVITFTETGPKKPINLGNDFPYFDVRGNDGFKYSFMLKFVPDINKVKIVIMRSSKQKELNTNTFYLNSGIYHYKVDDRYLVFELIKPTRSYIYYVEVDSEYS